MKLQYHIFFRLIIPLSIGLSICILATVLPFYITVPLWTNNTKIFIKESIQITAEVRTKSLGNYIDTFFKQVKIDINQIHNYSLNIFSDQMMIKKYYRSYYSTSIVDAFEPPLDNSQKFLASTNFKLGINSYSDFLNLEYVNETSTMDNIFRPIYKSNNLYAKIYIGLNNGLFRRYPFARLEDYSTMLYKCEINQEQVIGYDPRCRIWYHQSRNTEDIKFTPPYIDAFSKKMLLSISKRIFNSSLIGVIAADFSMELLDQLVLNSKVLENGYTLLIDKTGLVISYPELDRTIINPMIWNIDNKFTLTQWMSIINDNELDVKTQVLKMQNNNINYYITYYKIPDADYKLVMIFQENDLYKDSNTLNANILIILSVGTVLLFIAIIIIIILIFVASIFITRYYTTPFRELSNLLEQMTKSNLDITLGNKPPISSELKIVHDNFENLLIAVKFGNDAYYGGNLEKALANYELAEKLMTKINNNKGLGVCYNNKANVYKQMNNISEAFKYYDKAIENINEILKKSDNKMVDTIILANRLMNKAVLYSDITINTKKINSSSTIMEQYGKSEELYKQSIALNKECDNNVGIAKVSGNLGQLYIKKKNLIEAEKILYEAYNIIQEKNDNRSLQYMTLNIGILKYHEKKYSEALEWLNYTLNNFDKLEIYVQKNCLQYLSKTYKKINNNDMVNKINSLLYEPKNIYFVLDCSGSMDGNPLKQCKDSIIDIINNYIEDYDNISLITFNTTYQTVIPTTKKNINQNIINKINQIKAGGYTAFYSAVNEAINNLKKNNCSNKDWIIALTDGEDNSSDISSLQLINNIKILAGNIVVITIGSLKNENIIKNICNANGKGHHIKIGVNDISSAFRKVANMIIGQVNVEVL